MNTPPIAPVSTTSQGGNYQYTNILNKIAAKTNQFGANIGLVQIGL